jgi:DNA primase
MGSNTEANNTAITLPESFTPGVPRGAGEWLKAYGVTEDDVKRYGIGYDTGRQRIVWPVRESGELLSWQARDWLGRSKLKWLTPKGVSTSPVFYSLGKPIKPDYCVIVEDVLSAMRVGKMYHSLALLGTSATPKKLSRIAAWYHKSKAKQVVLLLDDDAPDKALKIITALTHRGIPAILRIGRLGKDPKEYTSEELIKIIEG